MNFGPYLYYATKYIKETLNDGGKSLNESIVKREKEIEEFESNLFSTLRKAIIDNTSDGFVKL